MWLVLAVAPAAALFPSSAHAATDTWVGGGGVDNTFTNAANWLGGVIPTAGDILVFDGNQDLTANNNFPVGTNFGGIQFAPTVTGPFTVGGFAINLTGNITDNTQSILNTLSLNSITFGSNSTISVVNNGALVVNSVLAGTANLTETGGGTLTLGAKNTFTGTITVTGNSVLTIGSVLGVTPDQNLGNTTSLTLDAGTTLNIPVATGTTAGNGTLTSGPVNMTLSTSRGIFVGPSSGSGSAIINIQNAAQVNGALANLLTVTYDGVIGNNGAGTGGLTKTGSGNLVLGGANTYSGATTIGSGNLSLDFTQAGAPVNNIINPASALVMGGSVAGTAAINYSTLLVNANSTTAHAQTFSGTTFNVGNSVIQGASGNGTGSVTVNLGNLTDTAGGTVVFIAPAVGTFTSSNSNAQLINGILGGWATTGPANQTLQSNVAITQGNAYATLDANGNITPYTGYLKVTGTSTLTGMAGVSAASNVQIVGGSSYVVSTGSGTAGTVDLNTVSFNNSTTFDGLFIGAGNTLRLGQFGGIMKQDITTSGQVLTIGGGTNAVQSGNGAAGSQDVGTLTAGGPSNLAGQIVFNIGSSSFTSGTVIVEAVIADNGSNPVSVVKTGAGSMKLDGHNTFTGGLTIASGRLQFAGSEIGTGNPNGGGTGTITILPGGQLFPSGATSGPITNPFKIAGFGVASELDGAMRLNGNTLSGPITLIGDAEIGSGGTAILSGQISGPFNFFIGATATINGTVTLANPASNNSYTGNSVVQENSHGADGLILGASEQIPNGLGFGNFIINGGANAVTVDLHGFNETVNGLQSGANATNSVITNNGTAASTLTLGDNDQTATFSGIIQNGTGLIGINKIGKGAETLTAANTYTGNTSISGGTLIVTGSLAGSGIVNITANATASGTLAGTGTVGNVIVGANSGANVGVLSPGATSGSVGTLSVSGLTVSGGRLDLDLSSGGNSDKIVSSGAVLFNGPFILNPSAGAAPGSYTVLTAPSITYATNPTLISPTNSRLSFTDTLSSTSIIINVNGQVANLTWTGAGDHHTWNLASTPNWTSTAPTNPNLFFFGDNVTFDDSSAAGNQNITINTVMLAGNVNVGSNTNNFNFSGAGGIGGGGIFTKTGTSTVTLGTANSFSGGAVLNSGQVNVNSNTALGTGPVTLGGASLDNTSGANVSLTSGNAIALNADVNFAGTGNLGLGNGNVTLNATRNFNITANTLTFGGPISDNGGGFSITKNGGGTLALLGNGSYSGNTTINAGTIRIGSLTPFGTSTSAQVTIASGAALDVGGFSAATTAAGSAGIVQQINVAGTGVGGTGAILNSSNLSQQSILQNVNLTADATFGAIGRFDLRSPSAGSPSATLALNGHTLTKVGTGQFSIVDTTVGAGNIIVNAGTLSIEASTNIGSGTSISYNNGTVAQFFANVGTVVAPMTVTGNVTMGNADNVNLAAIGSNISLAASSILTFGPVNNGAANGNLTLTGFITEADPTHPASILMTTTGTVTLSNPNSYSGGTTLNAGALVFSALNNLGNGPLTFGGGTLAYNGNTDDISVRTVTINAGGAGIDTSNAPGTVTFANSIGNNGVGGIIKNGFGNLMLSGANTFTGNTTINNGSLVIGNTNALPTNASLAINANGTAGTNGVLDLNGFSIQVGPISGAGQVQDNGATPTPTSLTVNTVAATGTTFSGTIFDGGAHSIALAVNGTGTLALTGGNVYSGGTTVNTGATLQVGLNTSFGNGNVTLNNGNFEYLATVTSFGDGHNYALNGANNSLITDSGASVSTSGTISGGGGFTKAGIGSLTLSGTQSYTGNTTVSAGTLVVTSPLSTTGTVIVKPTATFSGSSSIGGLSVSAANGTNVATIAPGSNPAAGTIGTLSATSLAVAGGLFQFDVGSGSADQIAASGAANFTAASTFAIIPTLTVSTGNYTLVSAGSLALGTLPTFTLVEPTGNISFTAGTSGTAAFGRSTFTIDLLTANQIRLDVIAPGAANLVWTGAVNSTWDASNANGSVTGTANWSGSNTTFVNLDNVTFNDTASNTNVTLNTTVIPGTVTFANNSKTYTLTGNGSIAGAVTLNLNGTGVVAIAEPNAYTGGTNVNAGTLAINNAGALGNGTLSLNGGNLDNTSAANVTLANVKSVAVNASFNFVGTGNLSLGNATVTLVGSHTINIASNTLTVPALVNDNGGASLTKTGNGTLALLAANTYGGQTTINGGVISVGTLSSLGTNTAGTVISGGTLDFGGITTANVAAGTISTTPLTISGNGAPTAAFPAGEGAIVNNGANNQQNATQNITLSADASVGGTTRWDIRSAQVNGLNVGKLDLEGHTFTKLGAGQISVVATDITSGNIVVNAGSVLAANGTPTTIGTLSLESSTSTGTQFPSTPDLTGTITYNSGAQAAFFQNPGLAASTTANAANASLEISAITWPMTFNGNNTIGNGGGTVAIIDSNATLNGNVTFESITGALPSLTANDPLRMTGTISGVGSVTKLGAASLVLANTANSYSGGTNIDGGILQFTALSELGTGNISFAGGTLQYSGNTDDISTRTITLNGASNGTLNGQILPVALTGGGTIDTNGSNVTFANPIGNGGSGGLTKTGNGTLTVNGANSWTGGTAVTGGTLIVPSGAVIATATGNAISTTANGTLTVAAGATISASPDLTNNGSTSLSNAADSFGALSGNGALALNGTAVTVTNGGNYIGIISGTGSLAVNGPAASTLILGGAKSYSGGTSITSGVLSVSSNPNLGNASGALSINGGTIQITGTAYNAFGRTFNWGASNSGIDINNAANTFTLNQSISGGGLTKLGAGKLVITGNYTTTNPTVVSAGTLQLNGINTTAGISGTGALVVAGGSTASPGLTSDGISGGIALSINGAAKIRSNGASTGTSLLSSLTFGSTPNTLDITNNKLILEVTPATHAASLASLQNEVAGGNILASGIPAGFGIAVMENSATNFTTFGGTTVDANSLLVSQELKGDANADGHVDLTDLSTVLNNFGGTTSLWTLGNFDGAAAIDLTDLSAVLNNFGATNPNAFFTPGSAPQFAVGSGAIATPEPASLAVLVSGAAMLLTRRRNLRKA